MSFISSSPANIGTLNARQEQLEDLRYFAEENAAFTEEMQTPDTDPGRLFRANKEFHFTIYRAAQMPQAVTMIENLWLRIGPVLHFSLGYRGREATSKFAPGCCG